MEGRDLPNAGPAVRREGPLDERHINLVGVDPVESLFRAGAGRQLEVEVPVYRLLLKAQGQLVAHPEFIPGGDTKGVGPRRRVVEIEEQSQADCRKARD